MKKSKKAVLLALIFYSVGQAQETTSAERLRLIRVNEAQDMSTNRLDLVELLIREPSEVTTNALHSDRENVVWIDWGEEEVLIVTLTEQVIRTGFLTAALATDSDHLVISFKGKDYKYPLVMDDTNQHKTLLRLNEVLNPDYELRMAWDSDGSDTLAVIPLTLKQWGELEVRFGTGTVDKAFLKLSPHPNIFTDALVRP